jgi:hypothetical protein
LTELSPDEARNTRRVNRGYRIEDLDFMVTVSTAVAMMSYCLYCLAPRTVLRLGSAHMIWTIPLVMYGLFRFLRVGRRIHKGDLVNVLLADKVLWLVGVLYVALCAAIIQLGQNAALKTILDGGM